MLCKQKPFIMPLMLLVHLSANLNLANAKVHVVQAEALYYATNAFRFFINVTVKFAMMLVLCGLFLPW